MKTLNSHVYDMFVIGGGSGGLAVSKAAANLGKRVGLADFVKPGPNNTVWGPGGTCVNVGCIPKKMMHLAAQLGDLRQDQVKVGWHGVQENGVHDWNKLIQTVQNTVKRLSTMQENNLKVAGVQYSNRIARIMTPQIVELTDVDGNVELVTCDNIVIAVGSRPTLYEHIDPTMYITSEDLFSMTRAPGKTLVVGASYVGLECAGFIHGLGYDTTVMARSILLRNFDQQMAGLVGNYMQEQGIKFNMGVYPSNIVAEGNQKRVYWVDKNGEQSELFDTVLVAIGRTADTAKLGLQEVGVEVNAKNGKVLADEGDQTSVKGIYAIGDCVQDRLELTPTAIMCGRRLANRLFNNGTQLMSYVDVATTVFTPLEYGSVGLSEEAAVKLFGRNNIKVYENVFKPVTWNISSRNPNICQGKLIVNSETDKVVGLHYIGPEAAEVTQGYAVAIRMGATKADFDNTVGIHPSAAEEMVQMKTYR